MMVTVTNRVILQKELARQRRVGIERDRSRPIELFVAERTNRSGGCRTVETQQVERRVLRDRGVRLGVRGIDVVDDVPGHTGDRQSTGEYLRQLNLQRVHGGDVVNDDTDRATVSRNAGLPRRVSEHARDGFESTG